MDYIGIDVGKEKYYIVRYSDDGKIVVEGCLRSCKEVYDKLKEKKAIIAIDAPSGPCKGKAKKRKCEIDLGIGGFYTTPKKRNLAQPWMQSGFDLWDYFRKYRTDNPRTLVEVHPTIIFKKIANPNITNPKLWISRKNPMSKSKKEGRNCRKRILYKKFPQQEKKIDNLSIDYIDALIAAYTAEQVCRGEAEYFGDKINGFIWIP